MTMPLDPQELRSELERASAHAKALALEVGDDDDLRAYYALISDVVDALVFRCPTFGSDDAAQAARLLELQEGPTERPLPSPFPPEA
jgi:hypothetical protein